MPDSKQCESCAYWKRPNEKPAAIVGECRRYAPRPSSTGSFASQSFTMWPETRDDDWCGE